MKTLIVLPLLLLFAGSASGQNLLDLTLGPVGMVPVESFEKTSAKGGKVGWRIDVNGDGVPDLAFRRGDDLVLGIFNDSLPPIVHIVEDIPWDFLGATAQFRGTANLDGDPGSEFLFENEGDIYVFGITIGEGSVELKWRLSDVSDTRGTLLAVADFTNDGADDLLIGVIDAETGEAVDAVQVWTNMQPPGAR